MRLADLGDYFGDNLSLYRFYFSTDLPLKHFSWYLSSHVNQVPAHPQLVVQKLLKNKPKSLGLLPKLPQIQIWLDLITSVGRKSSPETILDFELNKCVFSAFLEKLINFTRCHKKQLSWLNLKLLQFCSTYRILLHFFFSNCQKRKPQDEKF